MAQKRILFLGGAYAQIPIIKEARRRGMYIITCDYMPDNPGHVLADEYHNISTTDFVAVLNLARKIFPDFIVAYASDPAAPTAAFVSEKLGLPGNTYQSVRTLGEKDVFREFLSRNGFNTPKSISISLDDNVFDKVDSLEFPVMVKPTDSSGSKGITKLESIKNIQIAIEYALSFSRNKRIIIEEYLECNGAQLHGDGFIIDGDLFFSFLGDHHFDSEVNPFVPVSTTWPSQRNIVTIQTIEEEVKKIITLSGYKNGPVNIEAKVSNSGDIYIMEIGPRSGGNFVPQIINYATEFDMVSASLDILSGEIIRNIPKKENFAAYYVVHSQTDGILIQLSLKDAILPFIKEFHEYLKPGEKVKSFKGANAAIGIILLIFNSRDEMDYYISNMDKFIILKVK